VRRIVNSEASLYGKPANILFECIIPIIYFHFLPAEIRIVSTK